MREADQQTHIFLSVIASLDGDTLFALWTEQRLDVLCCVTWRFGRQSHHLLVGLRTFMVCVSSMIEAKDVVTAVTGEWKEV